MTGPARAPWSGTGIHYTPPRPRRELLVPPRPGEHVWAVVVLHVVAAESLRRARAQQVLLDAENIAVVQTACYVCDQAYSDRVSYRRCPGEPVESAGSPG